MASPAARLPLARLAEADLEFVQRFVLASGSLKDLAQSYGVSYPTIRARLDKLIERLRAEVDGRRPDAMSSLLADLAERGEITLAAAQAVKALHRELQQQRTEIPR